MPKHAITDEEAMRVAERYTHGETTAALAREYGVSQVTVQKAIRRTGASLRRSGAPTRLTDAQVAEAAARYAAGESSHALAKEYGGTATNLRRRIIRHGVPIRHEWRSLRLTAEQEAEALRRYHEGESAIGIGRHFGVGYEVIIAALKRHGMAPQIRKRGAARIFTDERAERVVARYAAGESSTALAAAFGTNPHVILRYVRIAGVPVRSRKGKPKEIPDDVLADILARWDRGDSAYAIHKATGINTETIRRRLILHGRTGEARPARGAQVPGFKGYLIEGPNGYVLRYVPADHPLASMRNGKGYVPEHRFVIATKLGRPLASWEHVHHIDGDKRHNDDSNLQVIQRHHGRGARYRCRHCGSTDIEAVPFAEEG